MPFPWNQGQTLTFTDLNAAFANAYAQAALAQTTASAAQGLATSTANSLGPPKPISVTVNWPAQTVVSGVYVLSGTLPYGLTVTSVDASIGSNLGVLTAQFRGNGVTIGNLVNLTVTQPVKTNFPAAAQLSNPLSVGAGSVLDVVINVTGGAPTDAYLCLNAVRTT